MVISNSTGATRLQESDFKNIKTKEELNQKAEELQNFFQTLSKIKRRLNNDDSSKRRFNPQKKGPINKNNKHEIQGLFQNQQHRAVQEILFGPTQYCKISPEKIEKRYQSLLNVEQDSNITDLPPFLWHNNNDSIQKSNIILEEEFTSKEVKRKLLNKIHNVLYNSRSVGLDRIKFTDLLRHDRDCIFLTAMFNACLRLQMVPDIWKQTYSVLIKENEDDDYDINNWRTVTMHNTTSKLFQALIASRMIVWAKETNRLSATQKGFLMNNAACESSFILQECKNYTQKQSKDLAVAWLDFSNAADSIPQKAVLEALNKHSVPLSIRNIIANMLQDCSTRIRTISDKGFTEPILIRKGLPQGSPLSPILLDLVIEPILRNLNSVEHNMFTIFNQKINHFAIPNELTLLAESATKLQDLLSLVETTSKAIGLKFNTNKCSNYHYDNKQGEIDNSKFLFFGNKLQNLPKEKINENFGVKQGLTIGQEGIPTIDEMIESTNSIDASQLNEFQKLEAVETFIIPRVENCLRGLQDLDKTSLEEADKFLKNKIKVWLHLPENSTVETIVLSVSELQLRRKVKFLPFLDLFYIMKIVHALKMFYSSDKIVQKIAYDSLAEEVSEMIHKKPKNGITKDHLVQYLSGTLHIKNQSCNTIWQMVRTATINLKLIKMKLSWRVQNNKIQLVIKRNNRKRNDVLTGNYECDSENVLKTTLVNLYINNSNKKNNKNNPGPIEKPKSNASSTKGQKNGVKKVSPSKPILKVSTVQPAALHPANFPVFVF